MDTILLICVQNHSKSCGQIWKKYSVLVDFGPRTCWLDFDDSFTYSDLEWRFVCCQMHHWPKRRRVPGAKFFCPSVIHAHTVWYRATKFGMITQWGKKFSGGRRPFSSRVLWQDCSAIVECCYISVCFLASSTFPSLLAILGLWNPWLDASPCCDN